MDPATILTLGSAFLMISIMNIYYIRNIFRKYIDPDDKDVDIIKLYSRMPFHEIRLVQTLTLTTIPMTIVGIFVLFYSFSI